MNSRDDPEKTYKVAVPDNQYVTVYLRDAMSVEEFLASACARKNLNQMEHFVRVKKRRDMEDHNYFVPHRNDLIETFVSKKTSVFFLSFNFHKTRKKKHNFSNSIQLLILHFCADNGKFAKVQKKRKKVIDYVFFCVHRFL